MLHFFLSSVLIQDFTIFTVISGFRYRAQSEISLGKWSSSCLQICQSTCIFLVIKSICVKIINVTLVKLCPLFEQRFVCVCVCVCDDNKQHTAADLTVSSQCAFSCSVRIFLQNDVMPKDTSKLSVQHSSVGHPMAYSCHSWLCVYKRQPRWKYNQKN